jgi:ATP-dependent exoDNAse (exonuclease V) alpha subunit
LLPIVRPPVESPEVAALEEILQSRDLAIAIQGPAGAGKTTFAAEAVRAIEALSGKDVMVLAPSSSAVNELRSRVTPKAETIQQFMINPELQDAARGGVLRIDEASFLSARAGRWLLEFARDSGTRLVVPGDVRQHHSVERGDWLRVMEQTGAICYAAITKIFRQQKAPLRIQVGCNSFQHADHPRSVGTNKLCLGICIGAKIHDHAFTTLQSLQPVNALS